MDRRRLLALCGTGLGTLAGCFATTPDDGDSGSPPTGDSTNTPSDGPGSTPRDVAPLEGSWESHRHDAGNTAGSEDPGPIGSATTVWQHATTTGRVATAPATAGGTFVAATESGVVYARDADDGTVRWSSSRSVDTDVPPVADGGTVVLVEEGRLVGLAADSGEQRWAVRVDGPVVGLAATDGRVVAATGSGLVAVATADGTERWRHPVEGTVVTPPGVGSGTVAVGVSSDAVLAVDSEDGERRWRAALDTEPRFVPAVGEDRVHVGVGSVLVALDAADGSERWEYRPEHPVAAPPVATAGAVHLATLDDDADPGSRGTSRPGATGTPTAAPEDTLWLEATLVTLDGDGSERWRAAVRETYSFTSGPPERLHLVDAGEFLLLGVVGELHAFDVETGRGVWSAHAGGGPAVTDGVVSTGRVGIDVADGSERWRFATGEGVLASPTVVENTVYAGSDDHYLHALAANTGSLEWAVPTDGRIRASPAVGEDAVYVGTSSGSVYALDRADGTERWRVDVGGQVQPPTLHDGTLCVGNFSQTLFALDAADGTERWRTEVDAEFFVALAVAAGDGAVYAGANGDLRAFETTDGSERWRIPAGEREVVQSAPTVADGRVFLNMGESIRALDTADGAERWSRSTGGSHAPPAVRDGTVYASGRGDVNAVHAFDAADGTERWRTGVGNELRLAVGDGAVYGLTYDTPLMAFDPEDGSVLWRHGGFEGTTAPALAGEYLFVGDSSGRVRAIGPEPE